MAQRCCPAWHPLPPSGCCCARAPAYPTQVLARHAPIQCSSSSELRAAGREGVQRCSPPVSRPAPLTRSQPMCVRRVHARTPITPKLNTHTNTASPAGRSALLPRPWLEHCLNQTVGRLAAFIYPIAAVVEEMQGVRGLLFIIWHLPRSAETARELCSVCAGAMPHPACSFPSLAGPLFDAAPFPASSCHPQACTKPRCGPCTPACMARRCMRRPRPAGRCCPRRVPLPPCYPSPASMRCAAQVRGTTDHFPERFWSLPTT